MPSAISHGVIAIVGGKLFPKKNLGASFWWTSAFCSIVPDADVVGLRLGIPYGSMFGHRGLSHSFVFALVLAGAVMGLGFRNVRRFSGEWFSYLFYFFAVTSSHGIFDAMTNGGLGIAFFAPFSAERYFLPFRPIAVSPMSVGAFVGARGLSILLNEMLWIWLPLGALTLLVTWAGRMRSGR